jgi:hypothetical protein
MDKVCNPACPPGVKRPNSQNRKYMDEGILGICIPIIAIIGGFTTAIYVRKYQHAERMAMIEKGVSKDLLFGTKPEHQVSGTLRASLLLIGVGLGFLMGYFLNEMFYMREVGYFSMLFIFGGLGLGLAYIIEEKKYNRP